MNTKELANTTSLLSDKVRLAIVAALSVAEEPVDFGQLIEQLDLTQGNLSSHMHKLESAQLVKVKKEFLMRKPRTSYSLTKKGRTELQNYLELLKALVTSTSKMNE